MTRFATVVLAVVFGGSLTATAPPVVKPASPDQLRGTSLVLPDVGLLIDAPGPDWSWFQFEGGTSFYAQRSPQEHAVYVFVGGGGLSQQARLEAQVRWGKGYFKSSRYRVASIRKDRVGQPFAGTQRIVMHGVPKAGPALYLYTYVLPMDVTLQVTSPISPEPEWISAWARSCRREQAGTSEERHNNKMQQTRRG